MQCRRWERCACVAAAAKAEVKMSDEEKALLAAKPEKSGKETPKDISTASSKLSPAKLESKPQSEAKSSPKKLMVQEKKRQSPVAMVPEKQGKKIKKNDGKVVGKYSGKAISH